MLGRRALRAATGLALLFSLTGEAKAKAEGEDGKVPVSEILDAARAGDQKRMKALTGSDVRMTGKPKSQVRESLDYREFVVWTGPDFRLGKAEGGVEIVVRVPRSLASDKLPELLQAEGKITDFVRSPLPGDGGEGARMGWVPVITLSILK